MEICINIKSDSDNTYSSEQLRLSADWVGNVLITIGERTLKFDASEFLLAVEMLKQLVSSRE